MIIKKTLTTTNPSIVKSVSTKKQISMNIKNINNSLNSKNIKNNVSTKEKKGKKQKKEKKKFIDNSLECRICGDDFDDDKEALKCGHVFHYDCIIFAFQSPTTVRMCPYCRKFHGYLRLKEGIEPVKGVHKEQQIEKQINSFALCKALYKTGQKVGQQCKSKAKPDSHYCGIHKKYVPTNPK